MNQIVEIASSGGRMIAKTTEVISRQQVQASAGAAVWDFGVDVMINRAGLMPQPLSKRLRMGPDDRREHHSAPEKSSSTNRAGRGSSSIAGRRAGTALVTKSDCITDGKYPRQDSNL